MRLIKYLNEALENYFISDGLSEASRVVMFTSRLSKDQHTNTIEEITEILKEKKIKYYIAYTDDAYLARDDDNILKVYNVDDDKGFEIYPKNTLIINRASVAFQRSSLDIISRLEKSHFFCINSRECIEICGDKFRTYIKLTDLGIESPKTAMVRNEESLKKAHENVGGKYPVVLKTVTGTKGKGVFIAESWKNMLSAMQAIWSINENAEIIMQEFIKSDGDYRIHILNDKMIACMKRLHGKDEFRANYSLGGSIEKVKDLDNSIIDLAIKASKAVGGVWTGVDIIVSEKTGMPYVLEVNTSPGTEGIQKASEINVVRVVLEYALNKNNWRTASIPCGYIENIWLDGIGYVKAKFDTGNGSLCSMHADNWEIKNGKIYWEFRDLKLKHDLIEMKRIEIGGLKRRFDERPVIKLDVVFNGETFKNILFTLCNRVNKNKKNKSETLMNRSFMTLAGLNIDPSNMYMLSLRNPDIDDKDNA